VAQIVFAGLVLASLGFRFDAAGMVAATMTVVAALTLLSIGFYLAEWVRHINSAEDGR
jgi:cardiolipin synthase